MDQLGFQEEDLQSFMTYTDKYTEELASGRKAYSPWLDKYGPYTFYPRHCFKDNSANELG